MLDIDKNILNNAIHNFEIYGAKIVSATVGSVDNLNMFPDNYFDLVFNEGVLEHHSIDVVKAVKEMLRVSKKYVVISIPDGDNLIYRIKKFIKRKLGIWEWDKYGYEEVLEKYFNIFNYLKKVYHRWHLLFDKNKNNNLP